MKHDLKIPLTLQSKVFKFFTFIGEQFKINIPKESIRKVFSDAREDQVHEKEYVFFSERKTWFKSPLIIRGEVGEYEPETLNVIIQNLTRSEVRIIEDYLTYSYPIER